MGVAGFEITTECLHLKPFSTSFHNIGTRRTQYAVLKWETIELN